MKVETLLTPDGRCPYAVPCKNFIAQSRSDDLLLESSCTQSFILLLRSKVFDHFLYM